MLLPQNVLDRLDYYTVSPAERRTSGLDFYMTDTIVLIFDQRSPKTLFLKQKKQKLRFTRKTVMDLTGKAHQSTKDFLELRDQLFNWVQNKPSKKTRLSFVGRLLENYPGLRNFLSSDRPLAELNQTPALSEYQQTIQRVDQALKVNYPLGSKVFSRTNEPGPLHVGEVIDYVELTQAKQLTLVLRLETGEEVFCMQDRPHGYTPEKHAILNKLTWWEQWNVLAVPAFCHITEAVARHKEQTADVEQNDVHAQASRLSDYPDGFNG